MAPLVLSLLFAPWFVLSVLDVGNVLGATSPWAASVGSVAALIYATGVRYVGRRAREARLIADVAFPIAVVSALVTTTSATAALGYGTLIASVWMLGVYRRAVMTWIAWFASVPFVIAIADLAGVPPGRVNVVVGVWGGLLLVGGLWADDVVAGRRVAGGLVRDVRARVVVWVGGLAVAGAWLTSFAQSRVTVGWWSAAIAVLALVVGLQLRVGGLSGVTAALSVAAVGLLVPLDPLDVPWAYVVAAAVLVGVAGLVQLWEGRQRGRLWWWRWDVPSFGVAHAVALFAVVVAVPADRMPLTWISLGALSALVGARLRRWVWWAAAAVLVLAGIGAVGPGWRAGALVLTSVLATYGATRADGAARSILRVMGALSAGVAWVQLVVWQGWARHDAVIATAVAAAAAMVVLGGVVRFARVGAAWAAPRAVVSLLGIAWAVTALAGTGESYIGSPSYAVSCALAATAFAAAVSAAPLHYRWLRELSALSFIAAVAYAGGGAQVGSQEAVIAAAILAVAASAGAVVMHRLHRAAEWVRPVTLIAVFGGAATVEAAALTSTSAMVLALLVVGSQLAAFGVGFHRTALVMCAPAFAVGAWVLFAQEALGGNPQWYTVPFGLALIVIAEIGRADRRASGLSPVSGELLVLEYAGMAFLVGAALLQTITTSLAYALVAIVLGVAISLWGMLTHVRRRALFGTAATALAVLLTIIVPMVRTAPQWRHGAALWLILATVGLLAIVIAALLERGIAGVRRALARLDELIKGWE
ncbi:MAG TPA: hypothetical protein VN636_10285 [Acidimicrobiia bacterium]|nr:hypothetical protein [Acidimicrobiia bacterium]